MLKSFWEEHSTRGHSMHEGPEQEWGGGASRRLRHSVEGLTTGAVFLLGAWQELVSLSLRITAAAVRQMWRLWPQLWCWKANRD